MSMRFGGSGNGSSGFGFGSHKNDEPEINLIPFIDVLLVVLIFLMLSTTYSKQSQFKINLPVANAEAPQQFPREVHVGVSARGDYSVGNEVLPDRSLRSLVDAMRSSAGGSGTPILVISADASASHQSVMTAMEAAHLVGINQVTFALQTPAPGSE